MFNRKEGWEGREKEMGGIEKQCYHYRVRDSR